MGFAFRRSSIGYIAVLLLIAFFISGCEIGTIPSLDTLEEDTAAAQAGTGSITGTVKDKATGQKLSGVQVTVNGEQFSTITSSSGRYHILRVPAGKVTVTVSKDGFLTQTRTVTVKKNRTTTVNFNLAKGNTNTSSSSETTLAPTPSPSIPVDLLAHYGWGKSTVVRWKNGTVDVYDATNCPGVNVSEILNTWNSLTRGVTTFRLSSNAISPVKIYYDAAKVTAAGTGTWGVTTVWWKNYEIVKAEIAILPCGTYYNGWNLCPKTELYLHEVGHVVGFGGHTQDGGVMDPVPRATTVTETVRAVISGLYSFPPGYTLVKGVPVPPEGMAVIYFRKD